MKKFQILEYVARPNYELSLFVNQPLSCMSSAVTATREHCFLCFETLVNHLTGKSDHTVRRLIESQHPSQSYPLFVTWTKKGALRGCIGTFSPQPLIAGLESYAITSAMRDGRFKPMKKDELESLECEVSLLHSFEQCKDPLDWEIGKHGTTLTLDGYSATFLPEVAEEWHWTKEQTLQELAMKGGMRRPLQQSDYPRIKLERYQSSHLKVTWAEYQEFLKK